MQKVAAKAKGKDKTPKTPKHDEMSVASKVINNVNTPVKDKDKHQPPKEKLRPRIASGKRSLAVKPTHTQTLLDLEHATEEHIRSQENSQSALQDSFRLKGKKTRSKDCEDAVNAAINEFWESAWNICTERFFITSAPVTVSFELRNAWLRIAEAEWQDLDMRETPNTRPNRIFKRDEPPLPLAFDTWSRGAMEIMPRSRHESVMDPFLRDLFAPLNVDQSDTINTSEEMDDEEEDEEEEETPDTNEGNEDEADEGGAGDRHLEILKAPTVPDDNWQLELDDEYRLMRTVKTVSPPKSDSPPKLSDESQQETLLDGEPSVRILLSPRSISMDESVTDIDSSTPSRPVNTQYNSRKSQIRKKFSPSQCGGRVGSGVFRFPTETTSEALKRIQENIKDHHIQSHVQIIDEDRVAYKQKRSLRSDDDMVVQPLFEEQTPRSAGHDIANHFHELSWRGVSYNAGTLMKGGSIDNVTADMDRKFLQRKLINLQSRFKKQSIKYFGRTAKAVEETAENDSSQGSRRSSTNSSLRSKNATKGPVDEKKFPRYASRSHVALGGNVSRTQTHVKNTGSRAKGTASDPGLPKRNKEPLFASLLERRLKAEAIESRTNNHKGVPNFGIGGPRSFNTGGGNKGVSAGGGKSFGAGGGGRAFSTGGGGVGGYKFTSGLARGNSPIKVLDPEHWKNQKSRTCKTCKTATNTSSS